GGKARVAGAARHALEVTAQERRQRGVDDRSGAALVLAEHTDGLVRRRDVDVPIVPRQVLGDSTLVLRVAEPPEKADRRRLDVLRQAIEIRLEFGLVQLA